MEKFLDQLKVEDTKYYSFKIGKAVASSLAGFISGFLIATLIWIVYFLPKLP
ncbi:MAG: hypothetical protein HYW34_00790 [Candidatus Brennerbacteria bacterium]|nr:hypothetical protein [Candidatus Brennerbacteria bacterium]